MTAAGSAVVGQTTLLLALDLAGTFAFALNGALTAMRSVRLDIVGGSIEIDRGVLDRMTGAFEHLLRNAVTHGIEGPADRVAACKEATGSVLVTLSQEGNEVGVEFRDDGAGLDLARIRDKGIAMGLLEPGQAYGDAELANLIFHGRISLDTSGIIVSVVGAIIVLIIYIKVRGRGVRA